MRRRQVSTFNLSFLDIMSCGLGAAVLLFLIIKHNADNNPQVDPESSSETNMLEEELFVGREDMARIRNTISDVDERLAQARGLARQIQEQIDALRGQIAALGPSATEEILRFEAQISQLEQQKQTLEKQAQGGNRVRAFVGQGERQYLTGLHLGGNRSLILLDSSSSMLDETIVNIIRRRNRPEDVQIHSPKWQQALAIVDWIAANLPPGTNFQIYTFSETAQPAVRDHENWIRTEERGIMDQALQNLREIPPAGGTSLVAAAEIIQAMNPAPDNIFLITDGLPTMGTKPGKGSTVSSRQRIGYFNEAYQLLPAEIPVNTLLLPMEGDPYAAAAFWRIALETRGSFIAPPRDWP